MPRTALKKITAFRTEERKPTAKLEQWTKNWGREKI